MPSVLIANKHSDSGNKGLSSRVGLFPGPPYPICLVWLRRRVGWSLVPRGDHLSAGCKQRFDTLAV